MDLSKYLESMKNLPDRFSNLAFWRGVRKLKDEMVKTFEYVEEWGNDIEKITENYVTPSLFGAFGDGVHDDTDAVQNAINSGRHVLINKNFIIKNTITIPSYTTIEFINNATIKYTGSEQKYVFEIRDGATRVTIKGDGRIDCNDIAAAISMKAYINGDIHTRVSYITIDGIGIVKAVNFATIKGGAYVRIKNCKLYASDVAFNGGIIITSNGSVFSELMSIEDNAISGSNKDIAPLVRLDSCNAIAISGNDLNDNNGQCVFVKTEDGQIYNTNIINNNFFSRGNYIELAGANSVIENTLISENNFLLNSNTGNTAIVLNGTASKPLFNTRILNNTFRKVLNGENNTVLAVDVQTNACGAITLGNNAYTNVDMAQPRNEFTNWKNYDLQKTYRKSVTYDGSTEYTIQLETVSMYKQIPVINVNTNYGIVSGIKVSNTFGGSLSVTMYFLDGKEPKNNFIAIVSAMNS